MTSGFRRGRRHEFKRFRVVPSLSGGDYVLLLSVLCRAMSYNEVIAR